MHKRPVPAVTYQEHLKIPNSPHSLNKSFHRYQIHLAGDCQPCYYHHKPGGCKKMEACPRCHFCSKERAKSFDKYTSAFKKRQRAVEQGCVAEDAEELRPPVQDANQYPAGTVIVRQGSRASRGSRSSGIRHDGCLAGEWDSHSGKGSKGSGEWECGKGGKGSGAEGEQKGSGKGSGKQGRVLGFLFGV